jgi:DNA-directed RNA polymerase subunit omega
MSSSNSMIEPSVLSLLKNIDNRYTLVVMTGIRARQLIEGAKPLINIDSTKPVTIAINEISQGKLTYEATKPEK